MTVLGDYRESYLLCLLSLQLGLVLGETGHLRNLARPALTFFLFLFLLAYGCIYQYDTLLVLRWLPGQWLVIIVFFACTLLGGDLLQRVLYNNKESFTHNYILINALAFIGVLLWLWLSPSLGLSMIIVGLLVFLVSLMPAPHSPQSLRPIFINKDFFKTISQGILSGIYVAIFFELLALFCYPSGFEYYVYLLFVFLLLTIASLKSRTWSLGGSNGALCFGVVFFVLIISFLFLGFDNNFFLDPINFYQLLPKIFKRYEFLTLISLIILILPYYFFSLTLPLRQAESPKQNHLMASSLGCFLGTFLMAFPLADFSLTYKIAFLILGLSVLYFVSSIKKTQYIFLAILIFSFLISLDFLKLDQRIIAQGQRLRPVFREDDNLDRRKLKKNEITQVESLIRKGGQVGYIYNDQENKRKYLGLGSYTANLFNKDDDLRAKAIAKWAPKKNLKVLIIGLGNHRLLKNLTEQLDPNHNYEIDVIDNFKPFSDTIFLNTVANINHFKWNTSPNAHFHYADAFRWLLETPPGHYDIIASNLTSVHFVPSQRLYTKEFGRILFESLSDDGLYIGDLHFNKSSDCPIRLAFPFAQAHLTSKDRGAFFASKKDFSEEMKNEMTPFDINQCANTELASITTPLNTSKLIWDYRNKDLKFNSIYIHFYNDRPDEINLKIERLQNTVELFSELNPTYNLDTGLDLNIDDSLNKNIKAWQEASKRDIVFAPMGSQASDLLAEIKQPSSEVFLISQITASSKLQKKQKVLSTFFEGSDYLKGITPLLSKENGRPENIVIVRDQKNLYFQGLENQLLSDLKKQRLPEPILWSGEHKDLSNYIINAINKKIIGPKDWIFLLDGNISIKDFQFTKESSYVFKKLLKIYLYGDEELKTDPVFYSNSVFSLFWHPDMNYSNSLELNQCDFLNFYKNKFTTRADFHSAYLYSSLQIASQVKGLSFNDVTKKKLTTILGTFIWDDRGRPVNRYPIYLKFDHFLNGKYFVDSLPEKYCGKLNYPITLLPK